MPTSSSTEAEEQKTENYAPNPQEQKVISKWQSRYKLAVAHKEAQRAKLLRLYGIYRGYRSESLYPYPVTYMPPVGIEIVQTFVSRLAPAKRKVRIVPGDPKDVKANDIFENWKLLMRYDFDKIKINQLLITWLTDVGTYGDGLVKFMWNAGSGDPSRYLVDLWNDLPAPESTDEYIPWRIERIIKKKSAIKRAEESRSVKIYKNLECVGGSRVEDWAYERYQLDTKKMSKIDKGADGILETNKTGTLGNDRHQDGADDVEIWECWDYEEDRLVVIMQGQVLTRDDENPYSGINGGNIYVKMSDIKVSQSYWSTGHIEPVESTILELSDHKSQRMYDIALNMSPVVKIKKDAGIKKSEIVFGPNRKWELKDPHNDVVIDRPPQIGAEAYKEEESLRNEIQRALAMGEYQQGQPMQANEPMGKVAMLIGQSNQRLALNAQNLAEAMTTMVTILIQMKQKFLDAGKFMRITGAENVDFVQFTQAEKDIKVDAIVDVDPVVPPDQQTRLNMLLMMLDRLVASGPDDKTPEAVDQFKLRKYVIWKMILEEMDKSQYSDQLIGKMPQPTVVAPTPLTPGLAGQQVDPPAPASPELVPARPQAGKPVPGPIPLMEAISPSPRPQAAQPAVPKGAGIMGALRGGLRKIGLLAKE